MLAQFAPRPAPQDPTEETLLKLLTTYQKNYGAGFHRTTSDFLRGFNLCFSLFLAWVGALCILIARRHQADAAFMLTISRVGAIFAAGALAVSVANFFLPPTVCLAVIFLGFAGASISGSAPAEVERP
jgi:hypothetical protein